MADELNGSQDDAVNRLMSAFRKELDVYAHELLASEPERPKARKHVDWRETPDYYTPRSPRDRRAEDHDQEPMPVQTPSANRAASPPLSTGRSPSNSATTPAGSHSDSLSWKIHMNKLVDTLEDRESLAVDLRKENDVLIRDYANLQEEMARVQATKIKPLIDENEDLRGEVESLRVKLSNAQNQFQSTKDSMEREIDDLRAQLREVQTEYAAMEQQNDRLHDRLRDYQKQSHPRSPSSSSLRYGETNGSSRRHGSYRERDTRYQSPGDALVSDLSQKTSLEPEDLAPLSKILDRRLGRETPSRPAPRSSSRY